MKINKRNIYSLTSEKGNYFYSNQRNEKITVSNIVKRLCFFLILSFFSVGYEQIVPNLSYNSISSSDYFNFLNTCILSGASDYSESALLSGNGDCFYGRHSSTDCFEKYSLSVTHDVSADTSYSTALPIGAGYICPP